MRLKWWPRIPDTSPSEESRREAQRAVRAAVRNLDEALRRDPEVSDRARTLEEIHRENNLGPRIKAALGVHS